jgi:hypothetical protein
MTIGLAIALGNKHFLTKTQIGQPFFSKHFQGFDTITQIKKYKKKVE